MNTYPLIDYHFDINNQYCFTSFIQNDDKIVFETLDLISIDMDNNLIHGSSLIDGVYTLPQHKDIIFPHKKPDILPQILQDDNGFITTIKEKSFCKFDKFFTIDDKEIYFSDYITKNSNFIKKDNTKSKKTIFKHIPLNKSGKNVKIVIASNINFYQKTIPTLIDNLINLQKISPNDIRVVVNNSPENFKEIRDGILFSFIKSDCWEYSALYDLLIDVEYEYDYFLLLHDTMLPGLFFRHFFNDIDLSVNWDLVPLLANGMLNLILFSKKYIHKNAKFITRYFSEKLDKETGVTIETTGQLTDKCQLIYYPRYASTDSEGVECKKRFDIINPHKYHTNRRMIYIRTLDLYKSQVDGFDLMLKHNREL